ncbi:MAG TPA: hypothetical protein VFO85_12885, partial [Vicinamibacteria bacterium]|nr:hypothetical protein [Vicinamibacteria bacterium]
MASTQQLPRVRLSGHRGLLFTLLAVLCVAVAGVYVAWAMVRGDSGSGSTVAPSANLTIAEHAVPAILFQHLAAQPDSVGFTPLTEPDGPRVIAPLRCARLHFAAGRGLCLHVDEGFGAAPVAYVFGP